MTRPLDRYTLEKAVELLQDLLQHPSDDSLDAYWDTDKQWFLTPLQWKEREVRAYLAALCADGGTAKPSSDALAVELLRGVMREGVEYNTGKYASVQMSHVLRDEIRAFLATLPQEPAQPPAK